MNYRYPFHVTFHLPLLIRQPFTKSLSSLLKQYHTITSYYAPALRLYPPVSAFVSVLLQLHPSSHSHLCMTLCSFILLCHWSCFTATPHTAPDTAAADPGPDRMEQKCPYQTEAQVYHHGHNSLLPSE